MPPKRSTRSAARTSSGNQGTLSFSKAQQNRVTKPSTSPKSTKTKKVVPDDDAIKTEAPSVAEVKLSGPPAASDPISQPAAISTEDVLGGRASPEPVEDDEDVDEQEVVDDNAARALSQAKVKAYWREKEGARLAPRVHQQDLTLSEKILREWDMSGQYGPCIGISRLGRWRRAKKLGLEPPVEVLAVLLGGLEGKAKDSTNHAVEERAYVDVLMGNRVGIMA